MEGKVQVNILFAGEDAELQRQAVDVLARCFEVWQKRKEMFHGKFPFRELSFVAMAGGTVIGHAGIIPFEVQSSDSRNLKFAGIASVAVAPEWRNQGIAGKLCRCAAEWATEQEFDAMPLYTERVNVYHHCGWEVFPPGVATLTSPRREEPDMRTWRTAAELSAADRDLIIRCYDQLDRMPGRVVRVDDPRSAMSWSCLFSKPGGRWKIFPNGYLLAMDGVLAEYGGDINAGMVDGSGVGSALLFSADSLCSGLSALGWSKQIHRDDLPECWEHEAVMMRVLPGKSVPEELFFPLANKF